MWLAPEAQTRRRPVRRARVRRPDEDRLRPQRREDLSRDAPLASEDRAAARRDESRSTPDQPLPIELDGEQPGTTPARFEIVPRALRVRVGLGRLPARASAVFRDARRLPRSTERRTTPSRACSTFVRASSSALLELLDPAHLSRERVDLVALEFVTAPVTRSTRQTTRAGSAPPRPRRRVLASRSFCLRSSPSTLL